MGEGTPKKTVTSFPQLHRGPQWAISCPLPSPGPVPHRPLLSSCPAASLFSVVLSIAGHRDCSDLFPAALFLLSSHTLFETESHVAKTVFDLLCSQCLSLSNAGITGLHQSAQLSSPTSVLRRHCPTAALSPLDSHSLEHLLNILPLCLYSTVPTILPAQSVCGR